MYRLIIADDEQIVCRALEHKIENYVEGIELLPSVHDGIDLLKSVEEYHPDIAIVDINMPELGGLEAIEMLRMKKSKIKIVINTAYSEFEYAKKALKLGASDYLLKPGTKEAIVETIGKICQELDREKKEEQKTQENQAAAESLQEVVESKWMQSLLLGEMDENCYQKMKEWYRDLTEGGVFTAWKLALCEGENIPHIEEIQKQILSSMREVCHCVAVSNREILYLFLMTGKNLKEEKEYEDWILEIVDFTRKKMEKQQIFTVVGIGRRKKEKEEFVSGIYEAKSILQGRDRPGVIFAQQKKKERPEIFLDGTAEKSAALLMEGRIEECICEIKQKIKQSEKILNQRQELGKAEVLGYLFDLEEKICMISGKQEELRGWNIWDEFREVNTVSEMLLWTEKEIRELDRCYFLRKEKENPYIQKAFSCLQTSYGTDISLDDLAAEAGISSFYLSRLFKQEKDVTFVELLTNLRIKKAVQLIRKREKTIREISRSVGYINMTYFYKVFKKTTGFTVGDMRNYL